MIGFPFFPHFLFVYLLSLIFLRSFLTVHLIISSHSLFAHLQKIFFSVSPSFISSFISVSACLSICLYLSISLSILFFPFVSESHSLFAYFLILLLLLRLFFAHLKQILHQPFSPSSASPSVVPHGLFLHLSLDFSRPQLRRRPRQKPPCTDRKPIFRVGKSVLLLCP